MHLPEHVSFTSSQHLVQIIRAWIRDAERRPLRNQNEQNDSRGEQVNRLSRVLLLQVQLRCLVRLSSQVGCQVAGAVASSHGASESEIGHLQIIVLVNEQILWLQVAMAHPLAMHVVERADQLSEVESSGLLAEPAS